VVKRAHFVRPNGAIGFVHFLLRVHIGVRNFCLLGINQFPNVLSVSSIQVAMSHWHVFYVRVYQSNKRCEYREAESHLAALDICHQSCSLEVWPCSRDSANYHATVYNFYTMYSREDVMEAAESHGGWCRLICDVM